MEQISKISRFQIDLSS